LSRCDKKRRAERRNALKRHLHHRPLNAGLFCRSATKPTLMAESFIGKATDSALAARSAIQQNSRP
jgi:hypothetical protein